MGYLQDLPRTFPGHPWLDSPDGHSALRRVLVAYSFRDSDVGYCQVGFFFTYSEESEFVTLVIFSLMNSCAGLKLRCSITVARYEN